MHPQRLRGSLWKALPLQTLFRRTLNINELHEDVEAEVAAAVEAVAQAVAAAAAANEMKNDK